MANMSHCMFTNTLSDLKDCYEHMDTPDKDLSDAERKAREKLIRICVRIAGDFGDDD